MDSVKGLFTGQTVCVAILDEERAEIYDAVVLDVAATGASANVVESKKCAEFVKQDGAGFIEAIRRHDESCEDGKELGTRVKASNIHPFTKEASQLIAKFKEVASRRAGLTTELKAVVAQIAAMAPKKAEKESPKK